MPAEILKHVRLGIETVRGTAVAPDRIIDFITAELDHNVPAVVSPNVSGGVFPVQRVIPGIEVNTIKLTFVVDFDRWQQWLAMGVDGTISATGGGANKSWGTIKPPALSTGAAITEALKSATVQFGYANPAALTPAHQLAGCVVSRLKLIGAREKFVVGEVDLISKEVVTDLSAFTGVLSPDVVVASPTFAGLVCHIDDTTIGTTADTTVTDVEVEWTGFMVVDETRTRIGLAKQTSVTAKITRFWETAAGLADYRTKGTKKVRLEWTGPTLGSGTYLLTADVYGYSDARDLGELSGFKSEEITLKGIRDATVGSDIAFGLVNAVTAI